MDEFRQHGMINGKTGLRIVLAFFHVVASSQISPPDILCKDINNLLIKSGYDIVKYFKIIVIFTYDFPIFATQNQTTFINIYETNT